MNTPNLMQRPKRWSEPFGPEMDDRWVSLVLSTPPFSQMDPAKFPVSAPLRGLIQNDCRVLELKKGDIVVREGDYGNSAFFILSGEVLVSLKSLPTEILGRATANRKSWFQTFSQLWSNDKYPEVRRYETKSDAVGQRSDELGTRTYLHDIPRIIPPESSEAMYPGELFGELSALTRSPRSATVVANQDCQLLEIRWQGLRDLMKCSSLKQHVESQYRKFSLNSHLREVELFNKLPPAQVDEIAEKTEFLTFGKFQWNVDYRSTRAKDVAERIFDEPLILDQGEYVNGLYLVRNGFVRICRKHGDGIQTVAYMSKGGVFGLREIVQSWRTGAQVPWALSLRAVGYVDVLKIPVDVVETSALPYLDQADLPEPPAEKQPSGSDRDNEQRRTRRQDEMPRGLLEFIVEERLTNGSKAMMIDLNRCTRCDDCVRACASTHNGNPRFVREGPIHDHFMFASACMHCLDPVCMIGCPTGAIARHFETGNVTINDQTCIGCATCANSCPYDNIRMVEINNAKGQKLMDQESGEPILKATKCDFCMDQWGGPACQRACPHDALVRIDLTEPTEITSWSK